MVSHLEQLWADTSLTPKPSTLANATSSQILHSCYLWPNTTYSPAVAYSIFRRTETQIQVSTGKEKGTVKEDGN